MNCETSEEIKFPGLFIAKNLKKTKMFFQVAKY